MLKTLTRTFIGLASLFVLSSALVAQNMPKTTTQEIKTGTTTTTERLSGTILTVDDHTIVVRMSTGDIRTFNPPPTLKYNIDGKELSISELKPGTKLNATLTKTATSLVERTTTVGEGKVFYVAGNTVILTLPNHENRQYQVKSDYKFIVNGQPATVFDLRKGMTVSAEKIVEEPKVDISEARVVTGTAPPAPAPRVEVARAAPAPAAAAPAPAPRPAPAAAAPAPAQVATAPADAPMPTKLPKTASGLPVIGLLGFLCSGLSVAMRRIRS